MPGEGNAIAHVEKVAKEKAEAERIAAEKAQKEKENQNSEKKVPNPRTSQEN